MSHVLQRVKDKLEIFRVCATSVKFLEVLKFGAGHYIPSLITDICIMFSSPSHHWERSTMLGRLPGLHRSQYTKELPSNYSTWPILLRRFILPRIFHSDDKSPIWCLLNFPIEKSQLDPRGICVTFSPCSGELCIIWQIAAGLLYTPIEFLTTGITWPCDNGYVHGTHEVVSWTS